ncbi:MAG: class I SAM-dependent methyltransferase, partial [Gaiellaceae bacterium]
IEDDRAAVTSWLRHLRAGGWLLVSVPAGAHRFAATDVKAGHYRRYDRSDLAGVLESAGLEQLRIAAYGFPLGYALEAGRNLYASRAANTTSLDERTAASGRWLQPPASAAQLTRFASLPFRYAQRPFASTARGTGLVARARKPS